MTDEKEHKETEAATPDGQAALDKDKAAGTEEKMYDEVEHRMMYIPVGVTSFEALDAMVEAKKYGHSVEMLTYQLKELIDNIMINSEIVDKAAAVEAVSAEFARRVRNPEEMKETEGFRQSVVEAVTGAIQSIFSSPGSSAGKAMTKTEGGVAYPAADFAYTPDRETPSTWKLRLAEGRPGNITVAQLGRAAAAFSSGGFRGNRVQIPAADVARVKARIRREYRKLNVPADQIPDSIKEAAEFSVWKEADGTYRWFAVFSNKYRDADHPPEILSEAAHKDFEQALDSGQWPYPDLYAGWHVPYVVGKADMVAYVDGFQTASGTYHKGMEWAAEGHMKAGDLMVSHGMPRPEIERDEKDNTVLIRYRSKEISPLPGWAAANKMTGFQILKEETMAGIPDHKRDWFNEVFGTEGVQKIEAGLQNAGKAADDAGVESKEAGGENEGQAAGEGKAAGQAQVEGITAADLKEILVPIVTNITTLAKAVEALNAQVGQLSQSAEKQALKTLQMTPAASLKELVAGLPFTEETKVDGRYSYAKDKPTTEDGQNKYGSGFVANLLAGFDELNGVIDQQ